MKPYKRRIGSKAYSTAGTVDTIEMPRNFNYRKLLCRLSGSVAIVGGSGAGSARTYAAFRAISKIEVVANGRDTVHSVAPEDLAVLNTIDYGTPPVFTNPSDDAASTTYTFNCFFIVPFEMKRSVRPIDTLLPSAGLSTLDLKVTWGAGSDLYTGSDFTSATIQTTTTLTVESFEEIGVVPGGVSVHKLYTITKAVTGANSNFQIQVSVGNLYAGFLVSSYSTTALINTVIDGLTLQSGTEVYQTWLSDDELIDYNKLSFGLESRLVGYHYLDFQDSDGFLSEILDTRNISNLDIMLNVAAVTSTIRVVPQEIIVAKAA